MGVRGGGGTVPAIPRKGTAGKERKPTDPVTPPMPWGIDIEDISINRSAGI